METENLAPAFGLAVRALRLAKGFSQEGFAYHCGVHRTYMGQIERGQRVVTINTALKIARGLELTLSELFRQMEA